MAVIWVRKEQEKEARELADFYNAPGWEEVFADFDELGRLKTKKEKP